MPMSQLRISNIESDHVLAEILALRFQTRFWLKLSDRSCKFWDHVLAKILALRFEVRALGLTPVKRLCPQLRTSNIKSDHGLVKITTLRLYVVCWLKVSVCSRSFPDHVLAKILNLPHAYVHSCALQALNQSAFWLKFSRCVLRSGLRVWHLSHAYVHSCAPQTLNQITVWLKFSHCVCSLCVG